jgi:hypothetical protein
VSDRQHRLERRRMLGSAAPLPPEVRGHFTSSELAVLTIVGAEAHASGYCALNVQDLAAMSSTSAGSVFRALDKAVEFGLIEVQQRGWEARLVRVVSPQFRAWLAAGKPDVAALEAEPVRCQPPQPKQGDIDAAPEHDRVHGVCE